MKSKRLLAVMLSGFMVLGSMTPVFAEEVKNENTKDNAVVSEEQQGNDVNSSEEVKTNDEAVTDKDNEDKTSEDVKAEDEKKAEENTSSNESSKTVKSTSKFVKSSSKTAKAVVTNQVDETTGFKFSYDEDTKEAALTGVGTFSATEESFTVPREVNVAGSDEKYTVTSIAVSAFFDEAPFASIKYLTIPKNIEFVGFASFGEAFKNVETVTFEEGSHLKEIGSGAFCYLSKIKSITIPKSVEKIDYNTFSGCSSLSSFEFEEGSALKSLGSSGAVFDECPNLTSIVLPKSLEVLSGLKSSSITSIAFEEGSKLKTIANYAFSGSKITEITIPKSVESIGDSAFSDCSDLTSITFEKGSALTSIGFQTFADSGIKRITIPKNVTTLDTHAFSGCSALEMMDTEEGSDLTSIDRILSGGYDNLKTIRMTSPNITSVDSSFGKKSDGTKVDGFTIIAHKGSAASKSALYKYCENNNDGSWVFKTEGVCHGPDEVATTRVEPTCLTPGSVTYQAGTCECGNEVSEQVSVVLPVSRTHDYKDITDKEATCTDKGSKHRECSVCGDKEDGSDVDIPMLAHTYAEIIDTPATCTEEGSKHSECSVCNTKKENSDEKIGVLPHTFDKEVVDKEATCTVKGSKHVVCSVCNTIDDSSYEDIAMLPHKFDKEVIDKEATYTEEGSKHTECSICGTKKEGSDVVIPKIVKEEDKNNNNNNGDSTSDGSTVTKTGNDKTAVNTPQTSDEMNMVLYVLLGLVSLGAVGTVGYKLKKRNI
ncbi:leucine-rich repeat protein [Anaerofustis stercorihominis]|uniref:leucine-rich repeat protein n=1 Tax=Anaerofustis stercorihominis TaxID=214853 RepID=UPI001FA938A5|nr:leucine-rich repeat protein [Anaerofustis stercorihominis]